MGDRRNRQCPVHVSKRVEDYAICSRDTFSGYNHDAVITTLAGFMNAVRASPDTVDAMIEPYDCSS
jgi:hypothetical protein